MPHMNSYKFSSFRFARDVSVCFMCTKEILSVATLLMGLYMFACCVEGIQRNTGNAYAPWTGDFQ